MDIAPYGNEFVLHGLGTTEQGIGRHTKLPYQREHAMFPGKYCQIGARIRVKQSGT
jgi:hypothetical protein